ncbi:conserved hypothetical protein [Pseudarthrobacter chlorophenolicus A6]|uniref:DUF1990 domain-containing protein n=1 Tax=Pseudarthrobacter chlorophenolicus (strain ATCC 700700 / DSM 12829 / CIP 107037 / JCM 12360 / KCTC 9906 / NCIMB 13794 / A6) TaxID=452863 RepID=B8HBW1_PSECP|nr:DUF1990 domain-containing protein [Pseudarthrobacter chlorophenolicus]ACL38671.1 conserved hypothetical protein [Pseudarthrobacter chlorophenolicus A6]
MNDPRPVSGSLNYPGIGSTRQGTTPAGYASVLEEVRLGSGQPLFRRVADGILGWELQRRAGLRVRADSPRAVAGARVVSGFGVGPFRLNAPCEVVWVQEPAAEGQPQSAGFGYGTLPGHPARGEESFEAVIDAAGEVFLRVRAFSKPANWFYATGGLVTRAAQRYVTSRYIEGARTLAAEGTSQ